jgi:hypothetical protein
MQQFHFLRTNLFAATLLVTAGLAAQSDCTDHHKFNCERSPETRFSINGQSKSASVQVGVPTELNIILYKGQDYRISLAHDTRILGEHLSIRLVEKVREPKVVEVQVTEKQAVMDANGEPTGQEKDIVRMEKKTVYEDVRRVLWDNGDHDMASEIEFSANSSKRVVVEVMAPGVPEGKNRKDLDIGCVGILIEHMPTPNIGF